MCKIHHTIRVQGRYIFRRRVHFRNIISKPIMVALRTADPKVARRRAALLAARFADVKLSVEMMLETNQALTGDEIEAIFRQELEAELTRNLHDAYENAPWSSSVGEAAQALAEAFRIARRPNRPRELTDTDRAQLTARGLGGEIPQIEEYLAEFCHEISELEVKGRLRAIGRMSADGLIEPARSHMLRARADAWLRTTRIFDDVVTDAPNPLHALLTGHGGEVSVTPASLMPAPVSHGKAECQFQIYVPKRFTEVIETVIAELKADGVWKGDLKQQRRIMETFAWITNDLPLGDYNHTHVAEFKAGLRKLPANFSFGTRTRGAMSRPFADVIAEMSAKASEAERNDKAMLSVKDPEPERNDKTINRDLSTMATVAKHLAGTAWKSKSPGAVIMDFGAVRIAIKDDDDLDLRPPWTTAHMRCLFGSPIYTGGGGPLKRLKCVERGETVWHDAAYFAPLIWYYTQACREEICGLEVDEIHTDGPVSYLHIKDNVTRGRDGEKGGEKRRARRRKLPIHPELIRLGFLDYAQAIRAEGHCALFPELYLQSEKRGGAHFYERAWQHMFDYIADRMEIPVNERGKGPDIHSIRALGSSFYEVDEVNPILRCDVMGHAREGTNAKHYSKRMATEGEDVVLAERLAFIQRYVPVITGDIVAHPIRLLPLEQRSRIGSSRERKQRKDSGVSRSQ
ncbi:DUF6538 domain-containing protein [Sphingomonas sp. 35-24ZXX]|uniref:DUF6538 domain-containing protein n=1 Tax=Sphingomonas sp. 35-24ZXX TaxID=1545915 RepID=UPI0012E00719|nr:DUF6538 domain-containing protein [Sphingomonas sp. 35-24ZXX]